MAIRFAVILAFASLAAGVTMFAAVYLHDQSSGASIVIQDPIVDTEIVVWIDGAVATPGVYTLPAGSRLNDAVQRAGGFTSNADLTPLNLASRLSDEQRIEIPFVPELGVHAAGTPAGSDARTTVTTQPVDNRVNINTADAATLESLPGIGPAIAARIVEHRSEQGPFEGIEELAAVKGISPNMVDSLRDLITIGP